MSDQGELGAVEFNSHQTLLAVHSSQLTAPTLYEARWAVGANETLTGQVNLVKQVKKSNADGPPYELRKVGIIINLFLAPLLVIHDVSRKLGGGSLLSGHIGS